MVKLSSHPEEREIEFTGSLNAYYPVHVSFELTAECQLKCEHCYGIYTVPRKDTLSGKEVLHILDTLKSKGLSVVELTGGEPTLHPDFKEILVFCVDNFSIVGILSNGLLIDDEIIEVIVNNRNVNLSISVNGNSETHADFTGSKMSYERAIRTIGKVGKGGGRVFVNMNANIRNHVFMEETARKVFDLGASSFACTFADTNFGRAYQKGRENPDCNSCDHCNDFLVNNLDGLSASESVELKLEVGKRIEALSKELPEGFIRIDLPEEQKIFKEVIKTCGAGSKGFFIASDGNVGLCPMAVGTDFPSFGNIAKSDISEVFESRFAKAINNLDTPSKKSEECKNCGYKYACRGCLLRTANSFLKIQQDCKWAMNRNLEEIFAMGYGSVSNANRK